jgi:hypothetical protein
MYIILPGLPSLFFCQIIASKLKCPAPASHLKLCGLSAYAYSLLPISFQEDWEDLNDVCKIYASLPTNLLKSRFAFTPPLQQFATVSFQHLLEIVTSALFARLLRVGTFSTISSHQGKL